MISQTQTASNQYGFYAVPKKLQPKKKYRQSEYEDFYENENQGQNQFQQMQRQKINQKQIEHDFYVNQAPYPQFKPKQRGLDYGVQIQKGDLFDFDLQIQPLLQILVGRSVVSAINQLQQQKEKVQKKQKLQKYQKKRNAQLMVTQRLQAKSKRKRQQSQRRVLQKQIHVKNQKQVGKKLISRKYAKQNLLGLKRQVLNQLDQAGYLRSQTYSDLRINFQGWLYEQITSLINQDKKVVKQVENMINDIENQHQKQHKKKIQKQKQRRQQILDQRQRIKKLNQQKKEKKRIKKQRLQLNGQRQFNAIKFDQLLQKYHQLDSVLKFQNLSNGFNNVSTGNTVYVSGGLSNFILAILNSTQKQYFPEEIQDILYKLLNQSASSLEFEFSEEHLALIQAEIQKLNQNSNEFMKNKAERIQQLKSKISLSLNLLQLTKVHLKSSLHQALLQAILNIVLTSTVIIKPEGQTQDTFYEISDRDKARQQYKRRLQLNVFKKSILEEINTVLRVRFERKYPQQELKKSQKPVMSQDEWVDIYDGQGWNHHCIQHPQQTNRQTQKPVALNINSFQKPFIFDQRSLHYLRKQIQKVLQIETSDQVDKYIKELGNINIGLKKDIPIYDSEIKIE